jgi:hypothetical protein
MPGFFGSIIRSEQRGQRRRRNLEWGAESARREAGASRSLSKVATEQIQASLNRTVEVLFSNSQANRCCVRPKAISANHLKQLRCALLPGQPLNGR